MKEAESGRDFKKNVDNLVGREEYLRLLALADKILESTRVLFQEDLQFSFLNAMGKVLDHVRVRWKLAHESGLIQLRIHEQFDLFNRTDPTL